MRFPLSVITCLHHALNKISNWHTLNKYPFVEEKNIYRKREYAWKNVYENISSYNKWWIKKIYYILSQNSYGVSQKCRHNAFYTWILPELLTWSFFPDLKYWPTTKYPLFCNLYSQKKLFAPSHNIYSSWIYETICYKLYVQPNTLFWPLQDTGHLSIIYNA